MAEAPGSLPEQQVRRTRERMPRMRRLAQTDDERDGIELFGALLEYLDELCGPGFSEQPLPAGQLDRVAAMITEIRAAAPSSSPIGGQDQHQAQDQDQQGRPPGAESEVVRRLDHPINASVTLVQGRELAERLIDGDEWQAGLGEALTGLYEYLDQLHGGSFTELLNSAERRRVAAALADSGAATCTPGCDQPPRISPRSKFTGSSSCS